MNWKIDTARSQWPSPEREFAYRIHELETTINEHAERIDQHSLTLKGHNVIIGMAIWVILQGEAAQYVPALAKTIVLWFGHAM